MIAVLADRVEGALKVRHPDSRLHVFDAAKGTSHVYDFASQSRFPSSVFWDEIDDRLCVVDGQLLRGHSSSSSSTTDKSASAEEKTEDANRIVDSNSEHEIMVYFITSEYGIRFQDSFPRTEPFGNLVGIAVPRIYFGSLPPSGEKEAALPGNMIPVLRHVKLLTSNVKLHRQRLSFIVYIQS